MDRLVRRLNEVDYLSLSVAHFVATSVKELGRFVEFLLDGFEISDPSIKSARRCTRSPTGPEANTAEQLRTLL
ncbi:hypothetical protein MGALJ_44050 [Mycobacterium gallinarum]|uniref:Uncharacterized protein n=1 Tax=Mycobacterium gallinarum TaxID=39689 RepID=A0A9W4FH56_9MYCO|nr:hypothetical protein [Mycobacterium gallinarum]BBY94736.1 hypothetical protein MGALJ_44050 [Mycobacterium gallinarum]